MSSPTQRTLKHLRDEGWTAAIVEHWNPFAHIRQDLAGWIDVLCWRPNDIGCVGVQTTTGDNLSARIQKARGNSALIAWLLAGNRLFAHGWTKKREIRPDGRLGKRQVWTLREVEVRIEDVTPALEKRREG